VKNGDAKMLMQLSGVHAGALAIPAGRVRAIAVALALCIGGGALAQTPSANPMPDGSRDMFWGLGVVSRPNYVGAADARTGVLPVLQVQWSNGVFIFGATGGVHLSSQPDLEYGPLFAYESKRTASGQGFIAVGTGGGGDGSIVSNPGGGFIPDPGNKLSGLPDIPARLLAGGFFNRQFGPHWRWSNSLLLGAGEARNGVRFVPQIQYAVNRAHHTVSLAAGLTWGNRAHNQAYFGVEPLPAGIVPDEVAGGARIARVVPPYEASAGIKDVYLDLHWNYGISAAWLLTSSLKLSHLQGSAAASPLVERRTGLLIGSALAYRF
jgi:outer membrane protein